MHDATTEPGALSAGELRAICGSKIRYVVDAVGTEPVAETAGVSETAPSNGMLDLTLEQAIAILELTDGNPDADAVI